MGVPFKLGPLELILGIPAMAFRVRDIFPAYNYCAGQEASQQAPYLPYRFIPGLYRAGMGRSPGLVAYQYQP